jgi:hypothetical protein
VRRRLLLVVALAALIWAGFAAFSLFRLATDLRVGRDAAARAREHLGPEQVADLEPLGDLRVAATRLEAADERASGVALLPLRIVPVVGRQLRAVDALAAASATVARAGVDAVERAGVLFDDPAGEGAARVEQVRALSSVVDDLAAALDDIDDLGPTRGLVGPLGDARVELADEIVEAQERIDAAQAGARTALALVTGPRRYLVVAANNAEMRAGSGMWLQGGVLTTANGKLTLEEMVSLHLDADPPDGAVVAGGDLGDRWGFSAPGNEWRSLMSSPSFPDSAALAAQMWEAAGRGPVDGVLAVDAIGLRSIVAATGPVAVEGGELGADGLLDEVLHDQYLRFGDRTDQSERRDALAGLAASAVAALDRGSYPAATLMRTLGEAVSGRHLLAWSADPVEQAGWEAAGMDGSLTADSLLVSILNRGGNKLDWFLDVEAALDVQPAADGWDVALSVQLRNETPANGEPQYVQGPFPGLDVAAGTYRGILAVNVPGGATDVGFDGVDTLAVDGPDGATHVVGFELDVPRGETRVAVLRFHLPDDVDGLVVEPSARVPAIDWRLGAEHWKDSTPHTAKFGRT